MECEDQQLIILIMLHQKKLILIVSTGSEIIITRVPKRFLRNF